MKKVKEREKRKTGETNGNTLLESLYCTENMQIAIGQSHHGSGHMPDYQLI